MGTQQQGPRLRVSDDDDLGLVPLRAQRVLFYFRLRHGSVHLSESTTQNSSSKNLMSGDLESKPLELHLQSRNLTIVQVVVYSLKFKDGFEGCGLRVAECGLRFRAEGRGPRAEGSGLRGHLKLQVRITLLAL